MVGGYSVSPARAFATTSPDNGAANGISNGGEWTIYASGFGTARNTTAITDASEKGVLEITGTAGMSGQLLFDLSSMTDNTYAEEKAVKSAKLRITPVVSKSGVTQSVYIIDSGFETTDEKIPVTQFNVPRVDSDDFNKDSELKALSAEDLSAYPQALAKWQTDIDITGAAVTAGDKIAFTIEYAKGNTGKTEYATANIANNGRLNGGAIPLLYSDGETDYGKWVYPQIVFEYSDDISYTGAYADFIRAYNELANGTVTETDGITLSESENGSEVSVEVYGDTTAPIKTDGMSVVFNDEYVGNEKCGYVKLSVSNSSGEETAVYSQIVKISADYTEQSRIIFDSEKNPKGEVSITVGGKTYTDGAVYAKAGAVFTVDGGENTGYYSEITVTDGDDTIAANADGSYTMPNGDVNVSVQYTKKKYGTTGIAAVNSASIKGNGDVQGNKESAQNLVIGAGRITFLRFDLSDYDKQLISKAQLRFNAWNTANMKAVFYVPNNEWSENTISKNFCLDGTEKSSLSAFEYEKDGETSTISLLSGADVGSLIIPDGNDSSSAENGILKDYYIGSTGTNKTVSFDVTDAIKTALSRSEDNNITLMLYSVGGGNDASSVMYADNISRRPSLIISESAEFLGDDELVTEIKSVDDLVKFAETVNGGNAYSGKTVTLLNDIDLSEKYNKDGESWAPIGVPDNGGSKVFGGVFDGGNHSISGLYINGTDSVLGLFGNVSGEIKNLNVSGEITGSSVIGGIAAMSSGKITNCKSNVDITAEREAGGIVGSISSEGVISECENNGSILIKNKETYAGGIAAHSVDGTVESCINNGTVSNGTDGYKNRLGGIVGLLEYGEIKDCINNNTVTSTAVTASYTSDISENYVGGIVGYSSYGIINGSANNGKVNNAVDYAGGITGISYTGTEVTDCTNTADVHGGGYVGGISGINYGNLKNCNNTGTVTGGGDYVGGIAGYLSIGNLHDCFYDRTSNPKLETVGFNSSGTVTYTEKSKAVKAIVAIYNGDKSLKSVSVRDCTIDGNENLSIKLTAPEVGEGETYKFMIWDENQTPVKKATEEM